jgi:hypothetical protein
VGSVQGEASGFAFERALIGFTPRSALHEAAEARPRMQRRVSEDRRRGELTAGR